MFFPLKAILDQLLEQRRTGYLTRRAFLKRASQIGLAGSLADLLLESCDQKPQSVSDPTPYSITWESESDHYDTFRYLTQKFSQFYPDIKVQVIGARSNYSPHDDLVNKLQARQGSPDVVSLDVIWMDEFVNNGWIIPLDDLWLQTKRSDYLEKPLQAVTFRDQANGRQQIWAAPLHTDIGLLYYRKDFPNVISGPPSTWQELEDMSHLLQREKSIKWGYVWQGDLYEGLVCNVVELLSSYNANIFDPHDARKVTIYSSEAIQALTRMVSWAGTISPPNVSRYQEPDSVDQWLQGYAAFMRCWPNISTWSSDYSQSQVTQKFGIAPLPSGARSCLGGWQLAVNRYSKNQDAAKKFIQWMLQEEAQQYLAVKEGFTVTLSSIYQDKDVQDWNPLFAQLNQPSSSFSKISLLDTLLDNAQLRPVSTYYPQIADAIERHIHRAVVGLDKPEQALQGLQTELESIVSRHQQTPKFVPLDK